MFGLDDPIGDGAGWCVEGWPVGISDVSKGVQSLNGLFLF